MTWSRYRQRAEAAIPPELQAFFIHHSALSERRGDWEWSCPWCCHSIAFSAGDRAVAEGAARAHVLERHRLTIWNDVMGALDLLRRPPDRP
jgi:hypothetical protein